jgi:ERCC4-type nuclease
MVEINPMKLLIDHRERKIIGIAQGICSQIEIVPLPLADILIVGDGRAVAVERKTITDFINSVRTSRLWDQLLRFMKTEAILDYRIVRRIVVIHGSFERHASGWDDASMARLWASTMGAFLETLFVYETPIIFAENDAALAALLRILVKREESGANDKLPPPRWYRKQAKLELPTKDRKIYVLDSIPLIGEAQAKALLDHFKSIENVAKASMEELQQVEKIGKKKAQLIHDIFH